MKKVKGQVLQVGDTFEVDYFGVKVEYQLSKTISGSIRIESINASDAAKALRNIADKIFYDTQKELGIKPIDVGGHTAEGFLPVGGFVN